MVVEVRGVLGEPIDGVEETDGGAKGRERGELIEDEDRGSGVGGETAERLGWPDALVLLEIGEIGEAAID